MGVAKNDHAQWGNEYLDICDIEKPVGTKELVTEVKVHSVIATPTGPKYRKRHEKSRALKSCDGHMMIT